MASQSAMRTAIQQIKRGEELIKCLQSHLPLHTQASDLSKGIQQTLSAALVFLKSNAEIDLKCSRIQKHETTVKRRPLTATSFSERAQKRRKHMNSRKILTPAPYFDGHEWRKYGQKMIHNSKHPRSYYRCTNRDDHGCLATKLVQEESCGDSPMFRVTYTNEHTCKTSMIETAGQEIIFTTSPTREPNFFISVSKTSYGGLNNNYVSNQQQLISLSPESVVLTEEKCIYRSENYSSMLMNPTFPDLKRAKIEEDTRRTFMIEDCPVSHSWRQDSFGIEFYDVESILKLLS